MAVFFGIIILGLGLVLAARVVMDSVKRLLARSRYRKMVLTVMLISLVAVLPELFIAVASVMEGVPVVSLGNVMGINILNVSLVIGGATLIGGGIPVVGDFVRWEMVSALLAGIVPVILLMDGKLSRADGVILMVIYGVYVWKTLSMKKRKVALSKGKAEYSWVGRLKEQHQEHWEKLAVRIFWGLVFLFICSLGMVRLSIGVANEMRVPVLVISFVLVAIGTSLPEVLLEAVAAKRGEVALVLEDVLGMIVANSTLVLGIVALLSPIADVFVPRVVLASVGFIALFGLFWLFASSKKKLKRGEGLALIGVYLIFLGLELLLD